MTENLKKKKIIHSILFTLLGVVIGVIAVIIAINIINLQESPEIDGVNLEEEYPEAWAELGESLKYLELGEEDFYCGDNATYVFSDKFKEVFHKMHGGYYKNTSDEQIHVILLDKIDRMTTFALNAGEVYEKLKPIDGATIEAYLEIINKRIAENKAREEAELAESKTASAQLGYKIGSKYTFKFSEGNKELMYQGGDRFIDSDDIVYIASKTDDNTLSVSREISQVADSSNNKNSSSSQQSSSSSSKYISEQNGYKVGSVVENNGLKYTYTGKDIWQDPNGDTYKAMYNKDGSIELCPKDKLFGVNSSTDDEGYILPDTGDSGDDGQTSGWGNADGWTDESDDFDPDNVIHDPDDGSSGWNP